MNKEKVICMLIALFVVGMAVYCYPIARDQFVGWCESTNMSVQTTVMNR